MAIAFVKEVTHALAHSAVTSFGVSITSAPGAGNLLVLSAGIQASSAPSLTSVTDSKGNTWNVDKTQIATNSGGATVNIASTVQDVGTLTTSDTITLHFSANANWFVVVVHEFSGASNTVDQSASDGSQNSQTRSSGTTPTTTNANDLIWAAFATDVADTSFTSGSGQSAPTPDFYTNGTSPGASIEFEYRIVSATGAYLANGTGSTSRASAGAIVAYQQASSVTNIAKAGGGVSVGIAGGYKISSSLQYQRPNADIASTGWTPTPSSPTTLYDKLDETTPDDSDYITATAS